jgi:hypothetical protein
MQTLTSEDTVDYDVTERKNSLFFGDGQPVGTARWLKSGF